jgi:diaminohydroxyphosphoribosylaminopyrimidine deaminase/5-amino-6-(5-phosphoribosylamino)uracil reductase
MTVPSPMLRAMAAAATVRTSTSPNPWVGCCLTTVDGHQYLGATEPPGGRHAERVALDAALAAGATLTGATVHVTLEPCSHHGRTPPCADALVEAGVATVVVGTLDPDRRVAGTGVERLRRAGIAVEVLETPEVREQLAPYLHHRRTGRPFVVLKTASTLDGAVAALDGTSRWITGQVARTEVHRLRAESDAVLVGAGTVRTDDPELTVRLCDGPSPRRVVLGTAPIGAKVHPCLEWDGPLAELLDRLGGEGVLQVLVEGGPRVAASFHEQELVDRYVLHLAPALMGAGRPALDGAATDTIADLRRGTIVSTRRLGDDIEIVLEPERTP